MIPLVNQEHLKLLEEHPRQVQPLEHFDVEEAEDGSVSGASDLDQDLGHSRDDEALEGL